AYLRRQAGALFPVAIDVAIPVERPAKATLLEGSHENLEVIVAEKAAVRKIAQMVEHAAAGRTQHSRGQFVQLGEVDALERFAALVERAQAAAHVAPEFLLGHARLLEVDDVIEIAGRHRADEVHRLYRRARKERSVERDHALDPRGRYQGRVPRHEAAPV